MKTSRFDQCSHLAVRTWSWRMVITSRKATPSQTRQDARKKPDAAPIRSSMPRPAWTGMLAETKELDDDLDGFIVADDVEF